MKIKRKVVFAILDEEREYQDTVRKERENDLRDQNNISIAEWIIYIENQLEKAKQSIYQLDSTNAMHCIRKATALGVACLEHNYPVRRVSEYENNNRS